eukprot:12917458-Heterocapsa_arctica.AAC.1
MAILDCRLTLPMAFGASFCANCRPRWATASSRFSRSISAFGRAIPELADIIESVLAMFTSLSSE